MAETIVPNLSHPNTPRSGYLLVVDDNEMNRDMLSRRLERQGHRVEVATNGREALEMLKTQNFDLLLLDIMMPEMNGYEVLQYLQLDSALRHIPVIMITAIDEIESIVRCIELGAEDYLPKPFNPVLLKARIGASLEKKWLRDQQEAYTHRLDLENRRKSGELEQARRFQLSLLPTSPPLMPYLEIAASQKTASEVGGDYYDFFTLPDGKLLIAIGDATGHGASSGLLVAMTKAFLLATAETNLTTLLTRINQILSKIDLDYQLNMALLLLELSPLPTGGVLVRTSGGGIPPIYILREGGLLEEQLVAGLPMGTTAQPIYNLVEFELAPHEAMILMSDGLPETFNSHQEYLGFERLEKAIHSLNPAKLTANQLMTRVTGIGDAWANGYPLRDDVTLVVVKVK